MERWEKDPLRGNGEPSFGGVDDEGAPSWTKLPLRGEVGGMIGDEVDVMIVGTTLVSRGST